MPPDFVVDSSLLIQYFRAKDKSTTRLVHLIQEGRRFGLSTVVLFEVLAGADATQRDFWKNFFRGAVRLPFDERAAEFAAGILPLAFSGHCNEKIFAWNPPMCSSRQRRLPTGYPWRL